MNVFEKQEFVLVLFEDEDKYSVVETSKIQKKYCGQPDSTCFIGNGEISYTFLWKADFMW